MAKAALILPPPLFQSRCRMIGLACYSTPIPLIAAAADMAALALVLALRRVQNALPA